MSSYKINFTGGSDAIQQFRVLSNRISEELAKMEKQVEATNADWTGAAKGQYEGHKAQWNMAAQQMPLKLGQAQMALGRIIEGYGNAETAAVKMWQK